MMNRNLLKLPWNCEKKTTHSQNIRTCSICEISTKITECCCRANIDKSLINGQAAIDFISIERLSRQTDVCSMIRLLHYYLYFLAFVSRNNLQSEGKLELTYALLSLTLVLSSFLSLAHNSFTLVECLKWFEPRLLSKMELKFTEQNASTAERVKCTEPIIHRTTR